MGNQASQARPAKEVLAEVMDPCRSKSEHEWVASQEIERLTREVDVHKSLWADAEAELKVANKRIAELGAALKPFARAHEDFNVTMISTDPYEMITLRALRNAYEALAKIQENRS